MFLIIITSAFVTLCCPALISVLPYCESFSQPAVAGIFRYRCTVIYFIPQGDLSRCVLAAVNLKVLILPCII